MLARLWWKDARQFWPIWVLLAVIGLAAQWLILQYVGEKARNGELAVAALGWTCLYAFAVAAAAFAGERENRTLHLLDALPVDRWRLWTGKVSFAFVSTLVLGLLLFLAAALATDNGEAVDAVVGHLGGGRGAARGARLRFLLVGGHEQCSARRGVWRCTTALLVVPALEVGWNLKLDPGKQHLHELVFGVLGLIASGLLFIRSGPPLRPLVRRRVQPLTARPATAPVAVATRTSRRPRFWPAAARSLAWQTFRDLRSIWWWLALLCLAVPPCFYIGQRAPFEAWMLCILTANIIAGVSVFGIENRAQDARLSGQRGSSARVGLVGQDVDLAGCHGRDLDSHLACSALSSVYCGYVSAPILNIVDVHSFLVRGVVLITLAIPILCGMVIRRGITAGTVSLLVLILVLPPLFGLSAMEMMPSVFLLLVPLAFLAVSFAWSRDWMLNRPGARRWIKLAVLLAGCFGALFAAYVTVRVQGVPTLEPVREAQIFQFTTPTSAPAAENAADLYRQAAKIDLADTPREAY